MNICLIQIKHFWLEAVNFLMIYIRGQVADYPSVKMRLTPELL